MRESLLDSNNITVNSDYLNLTRTLPINMINDKRTIIMVLHTIYDYRECCIKISHESKFGQADSTYKSKTLGCTVKNCGPLESRF